MSSTSRGRAKHVDTVIIGNGPSALILSYILSGHIPRYTGHHDDEILHSRLERSPDLLHIDPDIYNHLRSSVKYSQQALPVNVLLDALLRPEGDVSSTSNSCVTWKYDRTLAITHRVIGDAPRPGGQWADSPVAASWNIGTLSYAEQLSLPGYGFADHWQKTRGEPLPALIRPTRSEVAEYFAAYPAASGIDANIETSTRASGIMRTGDGFYVASHDLACKHLVLASGTFGINLPPPLSLRPIATLSSDDGPVLIIGSGFTAADLIISTPSERKILHVFNWDPQNRPSPLRACHSQAYPEYALIFRRMKMAAVARSGVSHTHVNTKTRDSRPRQLSNLPYFNQRDWENSYEGFANAEVSVVESTDATESGDHQTAIIDDSIASKPLTGGMSRTSKATVKIHLRQEGQVFVREVSQFHYAIGRRGTLEYLSQSLSQEVVASVSSTGRHELSDPDPWTGESDSAVPSRVASSSSLVQDKRLSPKRPTVVSGQTLRDKIEESLSTEVAPSVFAIGSLTGDSLVRYAPGGCCVTAGMIMKTNQADSGHDQKHKHDTEAATHAYELDRRKDD